jgi:predicted nucleotidyltransferase
MTRFSDNIYSGYQGLTSATSSKSAVGLTKTFRFTGGGAATKNFVLPVGVQNFDAKCYIMAQGSAATSDKITVSAGGVDLITFSAMGSATGVVRQTTTALGTMTVVASACANLSTTAEVSAAVTLASVDTATDYQVQISFNRADTNTLGVTA